MRVVVKSRIRRKRKGTAEQKSLLNPQTEQSEGSSYVRLEEVDFESLFESLFAKLVLFFEGRQCHDPVELADITVMRVIEKLYGGEKAANLTAYTFGFAKNIFLEYLKRKKDILEDIDELKYKLVAEPSDENDADLRERKLAYYEECLAELEKEDREMLLAYYRFPGHSKLERLKMAEQMGITREALGLRIFHLKQKLKKRLRERLKNM